MKALQRIFASPIAGFALAAVVVLLGAMASLWAEAIRSTPPLSWVYSPDGLPWIRTVTFWVLLIAWAIGLWLRQEGIAAREAQSEAHLERIILRAPSREVYAMSQACSHLAWECRRTAKAAPPGQQIDTAIEQIPTILLELARFARSFAGSSATYGANLMIAHKPDAAPDGWESRLRFFDLDQENRDNIAYILAMNEDLIASTSAADARVVPTICLPVPLQVTNDQGRWLALPGAPMTFMTGEPGIHVDLDEFVADCTRFGDFRPSTLEAIRQYFANEGSTIRSFASFRVTDWAVLNIDSSESHLLGQEPEFYPTFTALIEPTLLLLADLLEDDYPDDAQSEEESEHAP